MKTKSIFAILIAVFLHSPKDCRAQEVSMQQFKLTYYVGIEALRANYEVFYPSTPALTNSGSWQLCAGVRIRSRLSIQAGYANIMHSSREDPAYEGTTLSGSYITGKRGSDTRTLTIPLIIRYSLIRRAHPRLQIDAIAGGTLVADNYSLFYLDYVDGVLVRDYHESAHITQVCATAGLGARYPFGRHLEGVLDWTYSRNLKAVPEPIHQQVTGNRFGLTRALSLGLRYRFAVKKKEAVAAGS
ncbi:outer membrane beta-barrel protein [Hymenobacter sp. DH14]|uniref:Outer membrane beta-barrel protein n=1 Tax=Hymenobacter cyanobacteriorum TaxID=2926463 RepID=A0A9X2AH38_9BACT|nr:outer membrane beta-barrel protein [Hymenobacter cyanobacteriorum]MCI1187015.1 outer membrane beta-barrel protein [Hymenobacter cyanobacteriorum]